MEWPANRESLIPRSLNAALTFKRRVEDEGGYIGEQNWLGNNKPHLVYCSEGHANYPHPSSVYQGQGICRTCSHRDPITASKEFIQRVESLGGRVLDTVWRGIHGKYRVICSNGHINRIQPSDIQQGQGICKICAWEKQDIFYVVENSLGDVKFGITSGDPRTRLSDHAAWGYRTCVFLRIDLPPLLARETETHLIYYLQDNGLYPTQGREYFQPSAKSLILEFLEKYLSGDDARNVLRRKPKEVGGNRLYSNNTSGFKGVTWNVKRKTYCAQIFPDGIGMHLGYFDDAENAARVYDHAAIEYFGPHARTNESMKLVSHENCDPSMPCKRGGVLSSGGRRNTSQRS